MCVFRYTLLTKKATAGFSKTTIIQALFSIPEINRCKPNVYHGGIFFYKKKKPGKPGLLEIYLFSNLHLVWIRYLGYTKIKASVMQIILKKPLHTDLLSIYVPY